MSDPVLSLFIERGALLDGHFLLSSGLHSPRYLQCARVLMDPALATRLGGALAERLRDVAGRRASRARWWRPPWAACWSRTRSRAPSAAAASSPSARTA